MDFWGKNTDFGEKFGFWGKYIDLGGKLGLVYTF